MRDKGGQGGDDSGEDRAGYQTWAMETGASREMLLPTPRPPRPLADSRCTSGTLSYRRDDFFSQLPVGASRNNSAASLSSTGFSWVAGLLLCAGCGSSTAAWAIGGDGGTGGSGLADGVTATPALLPRGEVPRW